jgi:hypothetical protein
MGFAGFGLWSAFRVTHLCAFPIFFHLSFGHLNKSLLRAHFSQLEWFTGRLSGLFAIRTHFATFPFLSGRLQGRHGLGGSG